MEPATSDRSDVNCRWVKDTWFGDWLVNSDIWVHYVIRVALTHLAKMMSGASGPYPVILDFGCGGGRALPVLEELFAPERLVGVDPDPAMLSRAATMAARCRCQVELKIGQGTALPMSDGSVEMIFSHQAFHHVADPERGARELYRVLKPGGVLLMSESCAPFICSLLTRILFRHPMEGQRLAREYLALLRSAGFQFGPEHVATPYLWWSRPDLGLLEWLGRPLPAHPPETVLNLVAFKKG